MKLDNQLHFDNHVSTRCKKAGSQLNTILVDLENTLVFKKKKAVIEAFVFSKFNYCTLVCHFTSMRSTNKIESIKEKALRLLHNASMIAPMIVF